MPYSMLKDWTIALWKSHGRLSFSTIYNNLYNIYHLFLIKFTPRIATMNAKEGTINDLFTVYEEKRRPLPLSPCQLPDCLLQPRVLNRLPTGQEMWHAKLNLYECWGEINNKLDSDGGGVPELLVMLIAKAQGLEASLIEAEDKFYEILG